MTKPLRDDLMVQQQISGAWQHFVGVIMLNQTGRKPVKTVLPEFLYHWPTPEQFLTAHHMTVKRVIRSLGMVNVRYRRLRGMTRDFLTWNSPLVKGLSTGMNKIGKACDWPQEFK